MRTLALRLLAVLTVALSVTGCLVEPPAGAAAASLDRVESTERSALNPEVRATAPALPAEVIDWAARGIVFEGPWREDEIELVSEVLVHFADRLGEDRLLALTRQAVRAGTDGQRETLTFLRDVGTESLVGSWAPHVGRITIYDGLFDPAHMADHYSMRFERELAQAPSGPVSPPMFIVAHELGHMLVDGVRRESAAVDTSAGTALEDLYAEHVIHEFRAHPLHGVNESVASEVGLWVYEIRRPQAVDAYAAAYLAPALLGE